MTPTLQMIALVQYLMMHLHPAGETYRRLERIETYLIGRYNREE